MKAEKVATIYARALVETAAEKGVLDDVLEEVKTIDGLLRENPDVWRFFLSPRVERSVKRKTIESAFRGKFSELLVNFLLLVLDKGRQMFLKDIFAEFQALHDEKAGIVRAEAITAVPLSEEALSDLTDRMASQLEKRILVTNRVQPEILGGLVVRFDGMVADGSLKSALDAIRSTMASVKFGSEFIHED